MSTPHSRPAGIIVETGGPGLAGELIPGLDRDRERRWTVDRSLYRPEVVVARTSDGAIAAAALTSARPATAATKIVDLWHPRDAETTGAEAVLEAVIGSARDRGDVVVKWEIAPGAELPAFAADAGFVELRRPWSAAGTEHTRGFALWLTSFPHTEPGYYAQTTLFTCGSVAALIAADARGRTGFAGVGDDRDLELAFWRQASNFPACEPVGLGVALGERVAPAPVEIALDLDGPALLEVYDGFDRDFRAELQRDSARRAAGLGIPIRRDRVTVDEIVARVAGGDHALLLIDEAPMHGETGPHWIVAHAAADDVVLVQDPWISVEAGETWVDSHDLPIRAAELEHLAAWGSDGYRGVVFVGRR